jgi:hypothetical protein
MIPLLTKLGNSAALSKHFIESAPSKYYSNIPYTGYIGIIYRIYRYILRNIPSCGSLKNDKFWVDELAREMSLLDKPVLDEVDSTSDLGDVDGLKIEELTYLLEEGLRE